LKSSVADQHELKKLASNLLVVVSFIKSIEDVLATKPSYDEDQASDSTSQAGLEEGCRAETG
jgi:hypothetical protein